MVQVPFSCGSTRRVLGRLGAGALRIRQLRSLRPLCWRLPTRMGVSVAGWMVEHGQALDWPATVTVPMQGSRRRPRRRRSDCGSCRFRRHGLARWTWRQCATGREPTARHHRPSTGGAKLYLPATPNLFPDHLVRRRQLEPAELLMGQEARPRQGRHSV